MLQLYVYFALDQLQIHSFHESRRFNRQQPARILPQFSRSSIPPLVDCGIWSSSPTTNPDLPPYSEPPIPDWKNTHSFFDVINCEQTGILLLGYLVWIMVVL